MCRWVAWGAGRASRGRRLWQGLGDSACSAFTASPLPPLLRRCCKPTAARVAPASTPPSWLWLPRRCPCATWWRRARQATLSLRLCSTSTTLKMQVCVCPSHHLTTCSGFGQPGSPLQVPAWRGDTAAAAVTAAAAANRPAIQPLGSCHRSLCCAVQAEAPTWRWPSTPTWETGWCCCSRTAGWRWTRLRRCWSWRWRVRGGVFVVPAAHRGAACLGWRADTRLAPLMHRCHAAGLARRSAFFLPAAAPCCPSAGCRKVAEFMRQTLLEHTQGLAAQRAAGDAAAEAAGGGGGGGSDEELDADDF